jgi:hypothetical protein
VFLLAAAYDGLVGAVFLLAPLWLFHLAGTTEPNHPGYVQFPAALMIVFAVMFLTVARDPVRFCHLIPFCVALKLSYCALAFGYWIVEGIPGMWKVFAIVDLIMALFFVWAMLRIESGLSRTTGNAS